MLWAVVALAILVHAMVGERLGLAMKHEALASSRLYGWLWRHLAHVVHLVAGIVAGVLWGHHVLTLRHHWPKRKVAQVRNIRKKADRYEIQVSRVTPTIFQSLPLLPLSIHLIVLLLLITHNWWCVALSV